MLAGIHEQAHPFQTLDGEKMGGKERVRMMTLDEIGEVGGAVSAGGEFGFPVGEG